MPRPAPSVIEYGRSSARAALALAANSPHTANDRGETPGRFARYGSVHIWLRSEAKSILDAKHGEKTLAQYERNGTRLNLARPQGKPVNLCLRNTASTYYAYRAAVRYYAAKHGAQAVRDYDSAVKREDTNAKTEAWQRVFALCCGFGSVSERRETRTTLGTRCCAWPRRPETGGRTDPSKEKGGVRRC